MPTIIAIDTDEAIAVVATHGAPPAPTGGIGKDKVTMNDARNIESSTHGVVEVLTTANLLIIAHDAYLRLPEVHTCFADSVAEPHADLGHLLDRRISPIRMSANDMLKLWHIADIGVSTIGREESLNLITSLPISHMSAKHTAVIGALINQDTRVAQLAVRLESLAELTCHMSHLAVGSRRPLLLGPHPVPMPVTLIEWADEVDAHPVMLLDAADSLGQILRKVVIAVGTEINGAAAPRVCSQPIGSELNRGGVAESEQSGHSAFLGEAEETSLRHLARPIPRAIGTEKALRARQRINLRTVALLRAARAKIETPDGEAYALGLACIIKLRAEEPIGNLLLLSLGPIANKLHAPGVTCAEVEDSLLWFRGLNGVGQSLSHGGRRACRECERRKERTPHVVKKKLNVNHGDGRFLG